MQSGSGHQLPVAVAEKLSMVMAESLYLPPAVLVIGLLAVLFFERPGHVARR